MQNIQIIQNLIKRAELRLGSRHVQEDQIFTNGFRGCESYNKNPKSPKIIIIIIKLSRNPDFSGPFEKSLDLQILLLLSCLHEYSNLLLFGLTCNSILNNLDKNRHYGIKGVLLSNPSGGS